MKSLIKECDRMLCTQCGFFGDVSPKNDVTLCVGCRWYGSGESKTLWHPKGTFKTCDEKVL